MEHKPIIRPVTESDHALLYRVFVSTRPDITEAPQLDAVQKEQLLTNQFQAQHNDFMARFSEADYGIIEIEKACIGRIYVNRTKQELHLIDIAILPEYRGKGFGSFLITQLQDEGKEGGKSLRIHVLKHSPAVSLYKRHKFVEIGEKPFHLEMEWKPGS